MEIWWGFQIWYCTLPQIFHWTTKVQFLVYGLIWLIYFSLTWKIDADSKTEIELYLKWLTGPQKSNFLFMDRFEYFFFFSWKFDGNSKSDIEVYLKCLSEPQKLVIMIRYKINFDMIWNFVIFAANLYLSIFIWSSDILNFIYMKNVILVGSMI